MIYVLDTNVVSEMMKPIIHQVFSNWVFASQNEIQYISSISIFGIEKGIQLLPDGKRKKGLIETFERVLSNFEILKFDEYCAFHAAEFYSFRKSSGFKPSGEDMMIAGICAKHGAVLATRNVKDFEGLPIKVVNPWG